MIPSAFSHLPLRDELLRSLESLEYTKMTPVQQQSLPFLLQREDVIAQAQTGSGKTAAFGLSLLQPIKTNWFAVQALVLCPTRELAEQVSQVLRRLACLMPNVKIINLSGGMPMRPQTNSLKHGAHIVVGTPGRILKHLNNDTLVLDKVETLVLDEADRMLDMGFFDDIRAIISFCPKARQTLLFSATYPAEIKQLSQQFMRNPKEVRIDTTDEVPDIEQYFYEVASPEDKFSVLQSLLWLHKPTSTLIFCNTKQQTRDLTERLCQAGFSAVALHGDLEQSDRDLAVVCFSNQSSSILVATDVAARGLDIKDLAAVINYELAFEKDVHTHRIGRTGRAGTGGIALNLITMADAQRVLLIEDNMNRPLVWGNLAELKQAEKCILQPEMVTLSLAVGKKDKIRAGDILGALIKEACVPAGAIGKIDIAPCHSYVAVQRSQSQKACNGLQQGKLKGRKVLVRQVRF